MKIEAFRRFVRSLPCCVCGKRAEAHHVRTRGAVGERDEANLVPLCPHHHTGGAGVHFIGRRTFARRNKVCLPGLALYIWARWQGMGAPDIEHDLAF